LPRELLVVLRDMPEDERLLLVETLPRLEVLGALKDLASLPRDWVLLNPLELFLLLGAGELWREGAGLKLGAGELWREGAGEKVGALWREGAGE
jgi:hypothetical protein